jgi:serine/threonine-protein kinase
MPASSRTGGPVASTGRPFVQDVRVLPPTESAPGSIRDVVAGLGEEFARFDSRTQDSGHVSYGVVGPDGRRWFVKTSGEDVLSAGGATREERARALVRSAEVANAFAHPALLPVERILEADDGLALVTAWFPGELLRSPAERREDPGEAGNRFAALPAEEVVAALDRVIDVHVRLDAAGWTAGDLYDGCLMYDFTHRTITVMDFEFYHRGPFVNTVGRLPGSTRFMAPEEFELGATIDARTTVFTLGRMIELFLLRAHPDHPAHDVAACATRPDPDDRPSSLARLQELWRSTAPGGP